MHQYSGIGNAPNVWLPYTQMQTALEPLLAARTEGSKIYLADGRCLIDGVASWWTACHGYNHPRIRAAIERQLAAMPHIMLGGLVHEPVVELGHRLASLLPDSLDHVFFSESGSVAVEVGMKMALQYWINKGERRPKFVAFRNGYHGDTFAAMSVCDPDEGMHTLFRGMLAEQVLLEFPRDESTYESFCDALDAHAADLAGLIVEPLVQAAGGMKLHSGPQLARVVDAARERGILVLFDEIATGFARTGTMFALEQVGRSPDILMLSKALTGGTLPLAATIASDRVYEAYLSDDPEAALMHGPTYCGNPLACAAAIASLELFASEPRLEQARVIESHLRDGLERCRGIGGVLDVRVKGAIGAVQLEQPVDTAWLRARFVERDVWVRPFGDVVYLWPALTIAEDELAVLLRAVEQVVESWSRIRRVDTRSGS